MDFLSRLLVVGQVSIADRR